MAAAIKIRSAFVRLGFTAAALEAMTDVQIIDSTDDIKLILDADAEGLCKVVRSPGGQALIAGVLQDYLGNQVLLRAETNLNLECYYLRYRDRTSRAKVAADITLKNVRRIHDLCATERNHDNVTAFPSLTDYDWIKNIEMIQEFLRGYLGETRIPLAYVIRDDPEIPVVDPPGNYTNVQDEMIAHAPS